MPDTGPTLRSLPAILPRIAGGHHFAVYGDSCSGVPGTAHESNLHAVNTALRRLAPRPDFVCFLGDHIAGLTASAAELRQQWRHFLEVELIAFRDEFPDFYHLTSNHNTYNAESVAVWRECFSDLPQNGPPGEAGLTYWVRRGGLLLVMLNTASIERSGDAGIAEEVLAHWLPAVLQSNADASRKFVLGHHPIHPVNGYSESPKWCVPSDEGECLWDVFTRHRVAAYICSHIIAFDVQAHRGVLQITSGGAGTIYGPGGAMPCPPEYRHFVDIAADDLGLRLQTRDISGRLREWLTWPPGDTFEHHPVESAKADAVIEIAEPETWQRDGKAAHLLSWRFTGPFNPGTTPQQTLRLLSAWAADGAHGFEISVDGGRLVARRHEAADGKRLVTHWSGPNVPPGPAVDIEVAIHSGMGPGGVLWRLGGADRTWSSMTTASATGFEDLPWCGRWSLGPAPRLAHWRLATDVIDLDDRREP
jgi:hypothetical protein